MNILIRIPNWLGDAVMATFAMEILYQTYPQAHFYLVGSEVSCELFRHYPNTTLLVDNSKKKNFRILHLYALAKKIPPCDIAFTFQNNFLSALFLFFNQAKERIGYNKEMRSLLLTKAPKKQANLHESLHFSSLIKTLIPNTNLSPKLYLRKSPLEVFLPQHWQNQKIAGINAGAAFGSAKRWKEEYFAEVIAFLLDKNFKILLFGIASETTINDKILSFLPPNPQNILNLSGQTTIQSLMAYIQKSHLFITNDSGPMHIAAAFEVPTLAIFGPTNEQETSPFNAKNAHIISLKTLNQPLFCQPCKKRICPLPQDSRAFHACMIDLKPSFIIKRIQSLISNI
ncbi:lipopolysaccharide heptosyltransferase II [Helicobacter mesocricetorum]|uniref:lipopolysaccharide heptosyltransferase II n=1 Tax=Helicobacter mesocricetorum TaxID=87012 RepID=UPI000CF14445|nr:lipopolysaccharide heptosyltransferase II [Helicobacter mesocricetorum]